MKKPRIFKPGDIVCYMSSDENGDDSITSGLNTETVLSLKEASKEYNKFTRLSILTIYRISKKENNCRPIFISDDISVCWMPENKLFHYTKAIKLLYENKGK
jgi:hypothetical protein